MIAMGPRMTSSAPKGRAAADAKVPDATGMRPMPKQVASRDDKLFTQAA
jgi:hypothetical protein